MTRTNSGNTFYKNAKKKTNDSDDDDDSSSADGGDVNNGKADGTAGTAFKSNLGHVAAVETTRGYTVESMPDYQRRVMHVVKWIQTDYPDLAAKIVYALSETQRSDPRNH